MKIEMFQRRTMNPLQPGKQKQKRKPPRKACSTCPACLAPPCKECSNCTNAKSNKRCKQRLCPYLALTTSSSAPSAPTPSPVSSSQAAGSTASSGDPTVGISSTVTSLLLAALPPSTSSQLDISHQSSSQPAQKGKSQDDQETSVRKRQRLQEDHLMVEAVEKNFVLAKKAPRGFSGFTYQCLKCNVDFTTRIICIRHASTCGKAFTVSVYLKDHTRTLHNGQRDHKCNSCGKSFTQSGVLKRHI